MGAEDDGQYRTMSIEPELFPTLTIQETKLRPYYEGEIAIKKVNGDISYLKVCRFSGSLEYSVRSLIRYFNQCQKQFLLSTEENATLFTNYLEAPVRDLFFDNENYTMIYEEMTSLMETEYDSTYRQAPVQAEPERPFSEEQHKIRNIRLALLYSTQSQPIISQI